MSSIFLLSFEKSTVDHGLRIQLIRDKDGTTFSFRSLSLIVFIFHVVQSDNTDNQNLFDGPLASQSNRVPL